MVLALTFCSLALSVLEGYRQVLPAFSVLVGDVFLLGFALHRDALVLARDDAQLVPGFPSKHGAVVAVPGLLVEFLHTSNAIWRAPGQFLQHL